MAILETAYELMKEHGFDAISIEQIAATAEVGKATVYRWWSTKQALLVDAFMHKKNQDTPIPEDGSPLERIREHVRASGKFLEGKNGLVAARLLGAIQDDSKLRDDFSEKFFIPHSREMMALVEQAVELGDLPRKTDLQLFLDMQFGPTLVRMLMRHKPIKWQDAVKAFDVAVAGARCYWREKQMV